MANKSNIIQVSDVQQYSRMLFYVRKSVVSENQTVGRDVAKSLNLSLNNLIDIEECGLVHIEKRTH